MKRWIIFLVGLSLYGCSSGTLKNTDKPVVSVSILPEKYFIEQIAGDLVQVNVMIPPGESPATYEPSMSQLQDLHNSEIYMKIGYIVFELSWMDKIISANREMTIVDLSKGIELISGSSDHGEHHESVNPHIWMSPKNARIISRNIFEALSDRYPGYRTALTDNYDAFMLKLDTLENYISGALQGHKGAAFLIYHPALSYFARDYGLREYPLELEGKSPSPAHMKYLADLAEREHIKIIFLQMQFDQHNAMALAAETGAEIIQINPLDPDWYDQMIFITDKVAEIKNE